MTDAPVTRIAMWSGPRNISTAMMRAFENRADTSVSDEPFYAAYLKATGLTHPMRDAVLAAQPQDWRAVAAAIVGPVPGARTVWYQKHMTHHMLPDIDVGFTRLLANAFLIRAPEAVLASYTQKRAEVTLDDIGLPQQVRLFDVIADRLGRAPPVLDTQSILEDPRRMLTRLCADTGIDFAETMLKWPAGRRASDGVWAPAWYDKVEQSTGFAPPAGVATFDDLPDRLKPIAAAARPLYDMLARHRYI